MQDKRYCYPDSGVLINKLGIRDKRQLFALETELTFMRLSELQEAPVKGKFDFERLKAIHKYIFQDIYEWAGEVRTVEIGKGNLFCLVAYIPEYAKSVFAKYFSRCYDAKDNVSDFVRTLADNYGDLNALHPFREGNGRAQREFARLVCKECGYNFSLAHTTHSEMLEASILSFERADSSGFIRIFSEAVSPIGSEAEKEADSLKILTMDDMTVGADGAGYEYYEHGEYGEYEKYSTLYQTKISQMNDELKRR